MESRASRATTLLWKAYPLTQEFALTDEEVRFSVAYATGQRLDMPDRCSCARGTELTMEHTVHCAEKLTRHNMIQDRFVAFARFHGVHTRQNVRLPNQDADARLEPDVIFYPGTFGPVQTDITVINPCAPFRLKHHRNAHKWATTTKKREKERKYFAKAQEKVTHSNRWCSRRTAKWTKKFTTCWRCWQPEQRCGSHGHEAGFGGHACSW